jgi:hypothetical protein
MEDEVKYARDDQGKFVPGIGGGRPKGARNKLTTERQEKIEWVLGLMDSDVKKRLLGMKDGEYMRLWFDLHEYIMPKLNRTTFQTDSDEQITKIVFEVRRTPEDFQK